MSLHRLQTFFHINFIVFIIGLALFLGPSILTPHFLYAQGVDAQGVQDTQNVQDTRISLAGQSGEGDEQLPQNFAEIKRLFISEGARMAAAMEQSAALFSFLSKKEFRELLVRLRGGSVTSIQEKLESLLNKNVITYEESQEIRQSLLLPPAVLRTTFDRLYGEGPQPLREQVSPEDLNGPGDMSVGSMEFQRYLDVILSGTLYHQYRPHNRFKLLVDGIELRQELFKVIDNAKSFLNISQFTITGDRIGREVLKRIVANQMGISPAQLQAVLEKKAWVTKEGWPDIQKHILGLKRWYLVEHLRHLSGRASDSEVNSAYSEARANPLQVHLLLDGVQALMLRLKDSFSVVEALRQFGAKVAYVGLGFIAYVTNHTKIISNEYQALVQGNELVDKTYGWNPRQLVWHDAGVLIEGQLVNLVNLYFFDQFNAVTLIGDIDYSKDRDFYFPPSNESPPSDFQQGGRLLTHTHLGRQNPGKHIFAISMAAARRQILAENPFFADRWHAEIIQEKAKQFQLEALSSSQCEASSDQQKRIVVTMSKYMDQPMVEKASDSLIGDLLDSGISVCKWNGTLYNQTVDVQNLGAKMYHPEAMMHLKVWSIDDSFAYIGTSNWLARSRTADWGDLEIGLLTNDPKLVHEIQTRILLRDLSNSEPGQSIESKNMGQCDWVVLFRFP